VAVETLLDLSAADTVAFLRAESVWNKLSALLCSPHLRKAGWNHYSLQNLIQLMIHVLWMAINMPGV